MMSKLETAQPAKQITTTIDGASSALPFFVVGVQRSGTTMLRLMLDSHPALAVPFETGFITVFYHKLAEYGDLSDKNNVRRLLEDISSYHKVKQGNLISRPESVLAASITDYRSLIEAIMGDYAAQQGKTRWADKTPFYITDIDVLYRVFPDCKVMHLVRDGRDVAGSQRKVSWTSSNILRIAEDWRWKTTIARKVGNVMGPQYMEIRYEDLVLETEQTLRRICDYIDIPFSRAMLAYHTDGEQRMPAKSMTWHQTSVKPPDKSKVGAWKRTMPVADQILFEESAGDALELFDYELLHRTKTLSSRFKSLYYSLVNRW